LTSLKGDTKHFVVALKAGIVQGVVRGELSYLALLGSENISAPYFKQFFFGGGGEYYPTD